MLFDKFASIGSVLSIRVFRYMITGRSLGYAEVNFQIPVDAKHAFDTINFDFLHGPPLHIIQSQHDLALRKPGISST
ncbi:unnamed protein product [Adineta steineri]|uniref:RRM domain-containing protein n=1 Tax=Adineta steineri TaxID=433720 RepID=A0A814KBP4_9BILA|nr:unnamed protein product [Adineta steineri]CAF1081025.1 unnamed protein product [Adineta steineri]